MSIAFFYFIFMFFGRWFWAESWHKTERQWMWLHWKRSPHQIRNDLFYKTHVKTVKQTNASEFFHMEFIIHGIYKSHKTNQQHFSSYRIELIGLFAKKNFFYKTKQKRIEISHKWNQIRWLIFIYVEHTCMYLIKSRVSVSLYSSICPFEPKYNHLRTTQTCTRSKISINKKRKNKTKITKKCHPN